MPSATFPFRPWVRSTCRKAMVWGMGVILVLAVVVGYFQSTEGQVWAWSRAFGVLLAYSALFWASLLKIYWTAGRPAVVLTGEALAYQPLHLFRPRRVPYERVLAANPRPATESFRLVVAEPRRLRELFLNLAVVQGKHAFLEQLGEQLEASGLERLPGQEHAWRRPGWEEPPRS